MMSYAVFEVREAHPTGRPFHSFITNGVSMGQRETLYEAAVLMGALGLAARDSARLTIIDTDDDRRDVMGSADFRECYSRLWSTQGLSNMFDELVKLGYGRKEIASMLTQLQTDPSLDTFDAVREAHWYDTGHDILEDN